MSSRRAAPPPRKAVVVYARKPAANTAPAPKRVYVSGRGGYYVTGGAFAKGKIGPISGGAAINAGKSKGRYKGATLVGLGAYNMANIRHNVLISPDIPQVVNSVHAEGGTIVRHREYLGPIISSAVAGAFSIATYPLNPAQPSTFPWLSAIASNYEEYRPNGLMFEFRSTASDAIASSTNLALGQLMMCTQYDPLDPDFTSDVGLLNYTWAQSGKVSETIMHFVECDPKQSPLSNLYTRDGPPASNSDLRFTDFGKFSIASSGLQGTSVQIGQLWVTYEFILYKPKLPSSITSPYAWWHWYNIDSVTTTNPFGNTESGQNDPKNTLAMLPPVNSGGSNQAIIVFPGLSRSASYFVMVTYVGSSATLAGPIFSDTTDPGVHFIDENDNLSAAYKSYPVSSSVTQQASSAFCTITIDGDSTPHQLTVTASTLPGSPNVDIYVMRIPYIAYP